MKANIYKEIATKSWYNNYFKFINNNIYRLNLLMLSQNSTITFDIIRDIFADPNINIRVMDGQSPSFDSRFKWTWEYLSKNPNITFDNIWYTIDDPRFKWNWLSLSKNPNITFDDIRNTINDRRFQWDWKTLSKNPNITFDDIRNTIDDPRFRWNWESLSSNDMSKGREKYIKDMADVLVTIKSTQIFPRVIENIIINYLYKNYK